MIEKLQKLIAHERSAREIGSIAEAETFAAKIQELLLIHKLAMSEVEMADEERDAPVGHEYLSTITKPWLGTLAMGVCSATFCDAVKSHKAYIFIGRPLDRQAAISMFRHLAVMGKSICETEAVKYKRTDGYLYESSFRPGILRIWKASFYRGYASALYARLKSDRIALAAQARSNGTSLAYIGKSEVAIADYSAKMWGKLGKGRPSSSYAVHGGAYGAGRVAGSNVSTAARAQLGGGR